MPRKTRQPLPPDDVDLNQVVAYNVRAARELRGWTQDDLSERLESYLGQRLTQAGVSAIERAWDGDRRREFDAHELLIFAMVFDLPIIWFLLPPPDDRRLMRATNRPIGELYMWLLGRPDQLNPVYARLRDIGVHEPTEAEQIVEKITGAPASSREWSYKDRRKELLLALLDEHADDFDTAIDDLGRIVDHLRQVGIRGFVAEHTWDDDFAKDPMIRHLEGELAKQRTTDQATSADTKDPATPDGTAAKRAPQRRKTRRSG